MPDDTIPDALAVLTAAELDARVATALGHEVLGMSWAVLNGDGVWTPCPAGAANAELRPMRAGPNCRCDEEASHPWDARQYGFEFLGGHLPTCVVVVARYSADPVAMMEVLEWLRRLPDISNVGLFMATHSGRCWCCVGQIEDDVFGDTLMECVAMKAVAIAESRVNEIPLRK